ncbi:unnamed protein product [Schistosoma rodhaini]|nr:unnamed protein product [Schistosoma rodhaini]
MVKEVGDSKYNFPYIEWLKKKIHVTPFYRFPNNTLRVLSVGRIPFDISDFSRNASSRNDIIDRFKPNASCFRAEGTCVKYSTCLYLLSLILYQAIGQLYFNQSACKTNR